MRELTIYQDHVVALEAVRPVNFAALNRIGMGEVHESRQDVCRVETTRGAYLLAITRDDCERLLEMNGRVTASGEWLERDSPSFRARDFERVDL